MKNNIFLATLLTTLAICKGITFHGCSLSAMENNKPEKKGITFHEGTTFHDRITINDFEKELLTEIEDFDELLKLFETALEHEDKTRNQGSHPPRMLEEINDTLLKLQENSLKILEKLKTCVPKMAMSLNETQKSSKHNVTFSINEKYLMLDRLKLLKLAQKALELKNAMYLAPKDKMFDEKWINTVITLYKKNIRKKVMYAPDERDLLLSKVYVRNYEKIIKEHLLLIDENVLDFINIKAVFESNNHIHPDIQIMYRSKEKPLNRKKTRLKIIRLRRIFDY